jgi:hypothetical protein
MADLIETIKRMKYRKWFIFGVRTDGFHALQRMEERNLSMKDVRYILEKGELIPDIKYDMGMIYCVGKLDREFFTLVLRPLIESKAWSLYTVRPSNDNEKKDFKRLKREKKLVK